MVVDTSALVAILRLEPEAEGLLDALLAAPARWISSVTALEAALVIEGRFGEAAGLRLELFIYDAGLKIVPFDSQQSVLARMAWRKYGMNLGDCCVYALAKVLGEPVLCKGGEFRGTDIAVAADSERGQAGMPVLR